MLFPHHDALPAIDPFNRALPPAEASKKPSWNFLDSCVMVMWCAGSASRWSVSKLAADSLYAPHHAAWLSRASLLTGTSQSKGSAVPAESTCTCYTDLVLSPRKACPANCTAAVSWHYKAFIYVAMALPDGDGLQCLAPHAKVPETSVAPTDGTAPAIGCAGALQRGPKLAQRDYHDHGLLPRVRGGPPGHPGSDFQ